MAVTVERSVVVFTYPDPPLAEFVSVPSTTLFAALPQPL